MLSPATAQAPVTAPISLLRLIAENPEFRAKVESDPVAAFAEHGVHLRKDIQRSALPLVDIMLDESEDRELSKKQWLGLL